MLLIVDCTAALTSLSDSVSYMTFYFRNGVFVCDRTETYVRFILGSKNWCSGSTGLSNSQKSMSGWQELVGIF